MSILDQCRQLGMILLLHGDANVRVIDPAGAMTDDLRAGIISAKASIIEALRGEGVFGESRRRPAFAAEADWQVARLLADLACSDEVGRFGSSIVPLADLVCELLESGDLGAMRAILTDIEEADGWDSGEWWPEWSDDPGHAWAGQDRRQFWGK